MLVRIHYAACVIGVFAMQSVCFAQNDLAMQDDAIRMPGVIESKDISGLGYVGVLKDGKFKLEFDYYGVKAANSFADELIKNDIKVGSKQNKNYPTCDIGFSRLSVVDVGSGEDVAVIFDGNGSAVSPICNYDGWKNINFDVAKYDPAKLGFRGVVVFLHTAQSVDFANIIVPSEKLKKAPKAIGCSMDEISIKKEYLFRPDTRFVLSAHVSCSNTSKDVATLNWSKSSLLVESAVTQIDLSKAPAEQVIYPGTRVEKDLVFLIDRVPEMVRNMVDYPNKFSLYKVGEFETEKGLDGYYRSKKKVSIDFRGIIKKGSGVEEEIKVMSDVYIGARLKTRKS